MDDSFQQLLALQYVQQRMFIGDDPLDDDERRRIGMELALGLIEEVTEYNRLLGAHRLLPRRSEMLDQRSGRKGQIIDMLKYVLSMAHLDGFSAAELEQAFIAKTDIVRRRHHTELSNTRVVSFDIDGVICDLRGAGFDHDGSDSDKAAFFDSEAAVMGCEPFRDARAFLSHLRSDGWGIILVTTRKRHRHPALEAWTYNWLEQHGIPFDRVIFTADKADAIVATRLPVHYHVEDSAKHALDVASAGIRCFYVGTVPIEHDNIITVPGVADIWTEYKRELFG